MAGRATAIVVALVALVALAADGAAQDRAPLRAFEVMAGVALDHPRDEIAIELGAFRAPRVGGRFAVADADGFVAMATIRRIQRVAARCDWCGASTSYAILVWDAPPPRAPRHDFATHTTPVAIGPLVDRTLAPVLIRGVSLPLGAGSGELVDVDGDGTPDLGVLGHDGACARPARVVPRRGSSPCDFMGLACEIQARRDGATWRATERIERGVCQMDGRMHDPMR